MVPSPFIFIVYSIVVIHEFSLSFMYNLIFNYIYSGISKQELFQSSRIMSLTALRPVLIGLTKSADKNKTTNTPHTSENTGNNLEAFSFSKPARVLVSGDHTLLTFAQTKRIVDSGNEMSCSHLSMRQATKLLTADDRPTPAYGC